MVIVGRHFRALPNSLQTTLVVEDVNRRHRNQMKIQLNSMEVEHDNRRVRHLPYGYEDIAGLKFDLLEFQGLHGDRVLHLDKGMTNRVGRA